MRRTIAPFGLAVLIAHGLQHVVAPGERGRRRLLFTPDGDIRHPDGSIERGRNIIAVNRRALFIQREYFASMHVVHLNDIRCLGPNYALADGKWELRLNDVSESVPQARGSTGRIRLVYARLLQRRRIVGNRGVALYGQPASRHDPADHAEAAGIHRETGSLTRRFLVFLVSDTVLFGGLISAYFMLRAGSITWGWSPHRHLAFANTAILVASTGCFAAAVESARRGRVSSVRQLTWAAIVFGVIFLCVKGYEYQDDVALALYPRTSTRIALYYLLTAVHAAHVVGGLIVSGGLVLNPETAWTAPGAALVNRAETALIYWSFLTIIWVILVVLFYVW